MKKAKPVAAGGYSEHKADTNDTAQVRRPKNATLESCEFAWSIMDALSAHICVVDEHGIILTANKAWLDFSKANPPISDNVGIGANYLAVCDGATGPDSKIARAFAAGIRDVITGKRTEFEMEYPCHSPEEQRWFIGRVTPLAGVASRLLAIAHENITERRLAEEALLAKEEALRLAAQGAQFGTYT